MSNARLEENRREREMGKPIAELMTVLEGGFIRTGPSAPEVWLKITAGQAFEPHGRASQTWEPYWRVELPNWRVRYGHVVAESVRVTGRTLREAVERLLSLARRGQLERKE